jgi:hypothetical protein
LLLLTCNSRKRLICSVRTVRIRCQWAYIIQRFVKHTTEVRVIVETGSIINVTIRLSGRIPFFTIEALMLSSSPQALQYTVDPGLPIQSSSIPSDLWQLYANCSLLIVFKSSSPSPVHLFCGLPLFLFASILVVTISLFIPSVCPHHLNLSQFINFKIPALCNISICAYFQLSYSFM